MLVSPRLLEDVISVTEAIRLNCLSSGVATEEAIVSGLAPGRAAPTEMVGKSTCGSGETGRNRKATIPASAIASVSSVVATGLRIKGAEMLMVRDQPPGGENTTIIQAILRLGGAANPPHTYRYSRRGLLR
jgi:hypothetical protein